ncbi:MAG TPA: glycosyltransferase family 2 protein [Candidatus Omnitrophota bacterium]|nr:glycosyltransferase family 2 protein [Candidatus Omnitrophota bacterium]
MNSLLNQGFLEKRIAIVILNYNSAKDLKIFLAQLISQRGAFLSFVIVDNASQKDSVESFQSWLASWRPDAFCGTPRQAEEWIMQYPQIASRDKNIFFIKNSENRGFSAGNNIGIRVAEKLNVDAVLITNPDICIEGSECVADLGRQLFSSAEFCVAVPRVLYFGKDQNPRWEPTTFWEELFWLSPFPFAKIRRSDLTENLKPHEIDQFAGCFFMVKLDFLRKINYLDERFFLYREEAMLSVRAKTNEQKILYVPQVCVKHESIHSDQKSHLFLRQYHLLRSKKIFLENHTAFGALGRFLILFFNALWALWPIFKNIFLKRTRKNEKRRQG